MMMLIYILAAIIVVIILLTVIAPKTYNVHRSITIDRSKETVFEYMRYLHHYEAWSPWHKKDPNMSISYSGTDGRVGAKSSWEGNNEVGSGHQTICQIKENTLIESELVFLKPWKSQSIGYYIFEDGITSQTKLIWGFKGKNKFPATVFMLMYNMDKVVGKDFEDGLASLKKLMENG